MALSIAIAVLVLSLALALAKAVFPTDFAAARTGAARGAAWDGTKGVGPDGAKDADAPMAAARLHGGFAFFRAHPFNRQPLARWTRAAGRSEAETAACAAAATGLAGRAMLPPPPPRSSAPP